MSCEEKGTEHLLKLSILYHRLISDLEEVFGRTLDPGRRARAFQLIMEVGDEVKMQTLALAVLAEIMQNIKDEHQSEPAC